LNLSLAREKLGGVFEIVAQDLTDIIKSLEIKPSSKILDIGTGDGKMAIIIALNGFNVITGEPRDDESKYAQRNWQQNARKVGVEHLIEFKHFKVETLPFEEESFDYIISYGGFHHFSNKEEALKEMLRVIKSHGKIAILEPNTRMIKKIQQKHPDHPEAEDPRKYLKDRNRNPILKKFKKVDAYIIQKN